MNRFKELLQKDMDEVFFNLDEFATEERINSKVMTVVVDNQLLKIQQLKNTEKLANSELLFHAKRLHFEHIPQVDKLMDFNNKRYRIIDVVEKGPILDITLGRYQG